jgi:hypothetical protein
MAQNNRNVFSFDSVGQKSGIKVLARPCAWKLWILPFLFQLLAIFGVPCL